MNLWSIPPWYITYLLFIFTFVKLSAQQEMTQTEMAQIYEEIKTPYKYGLVIIPESNEYMIDSPTVFRYGKKWYMTYIVWGKDEAKNRNGYETWIAESDNLLEWNTLGRILSFPDDSTSWDKNQRAGYPALPDMEWGGSYTLLPYQGKYWMTYLGGELPGYETSPLKVGVAWTKKKNMGKPVGWQSLGKPILSPFDMQAQWFDNQTIYKSTVYWDKKQSLGAPFVMFYNAAGNHPETGLKAERIGIALSNNMRTWKRYRNNPVLAHEVSGSITGDAHIQKIGNIYVMFYFRAFIPTRKYSAYNTFACSYDLIHWYDWEGEDLVYPTEDYDNLYAHKSYVVKHNGVVYHFYCAVNKQNQRGIAVATSQPMGHSSLHFPGE